MSTFEITSARTDTACELALDVSSAIMRACRRHGSDPELVATISAGVAGGIMSIEDMRDLPRLADMVRAHILAMQRSQI